jgi:diguanylate cyclase (GGDEF)-like protein/PAS domain S-box-containing protein
MTVSGEGTTTGHVLIIEGDQILREAEAEALQRAGWLVSASSTGEQGLAMAAESLPEVIICGRWLPDVDGIGILARLGQDPATAPIPLLLVTGKTDTSDLVVAIDAGACDFLAMPFEMIELEARCRAALRVSRSQRRLAESEAAYRRIVDLAAEGIWVIDTNQVITYANDRMAEILGTTAAQLIGRIVLEFMDDEGRDLAAARVERRRAGLSETGDFKFVREDGTAVWTSLNAAPILDDHGVHQGSIGLVSDVSERHDSEIALARSEARYRALLDHLPGTIAIVYDRDFRTVLAAGAGLDRRGLDPGNMAGKRFDELVTAEDALILRPLYEAAFEGRPATIELLSRLTGVENLLDIVPISTPMDVATEEILVVARDIGPLKTRERALAAAEEQWRAAFEGAPVGMVQIGIDGRFLRVNPAFCAMLGYAADQLHTMTPADITHPDDADQARRAIVDVAENNLRHFRTEKRYVRSDGSIVWSSVNAVPVHDVDGRVDHMLVHCLDISELKRAEGELQQLATHDTLTGLYNRRGFEEALGRHVANVSRYGLDGALLVLDLDGLKQLNDTEGHEAGDCALVTTADLVRRRLRSSDIIARLGGDEYAIILPRVDQARASTIAGSIVDLIRRHPTPVTASIGIAMFDTSGDTGEQVLARADSAMYEAKRGGGDRYAVFAPPAAP